MGKILGPGGFMEEIEGWTSGQVPTTAIGGREQQSLTGMEQEFLNQAQYNRDIQKEAKSGMNQTMLDALTASIDAPVMEQAYQQSGNLKREGGGMGAYQNRRSSDMHKGETDIISRALGDIARARAPIAAQDVYGRQGRADRAGQQLPSLMSALPQIFREMREKEQAEKLTQFQFDEMSRDKRMQAMIQSLGIPAQISTSVGMGIGSFGESESTSAGLGVCHAAAEYFGWFTPEWFNARAWITEGWTGYSSFHFKNFYTHHSEALALAIRTSNGIRENWRPFFEWAERKGSEMEEENA